MIFNTSVLTSALYSWYCSDVVIIINLKLTKVVKMVHVRTLVVRGLWAVFVFQYTIVFTLLERARKDKASNSESMNKLVN